MATRNIGGSSTDMSYRYKMPLLQTKIEGRGNGIKTVIPNMTEIAKALNTNPAYPTKFFGVELGAQSKFDLKREVAIVNGAHDVAVVDGLLDKFIGIFVLCPNCNLPETSMKVKRGAVKVDCAACGYNGILDTQHKVVTYIINNPPKRSKKSKTKAKKESKRAKTKKDKKSRKKKDNNDEDDIVWFTDISEEARLSRKKEEAMSMGVSKEDETMVDRVDAILQSTTKPQISQVQATPLELLKEAFEQKADNDKIVSELRRIELAKNLKKDDKISILLEASLPLDSLKVSVVPKIKENAKLFNRFTNSEDEQRHFWAVLEWLICVKFQKLIPQIPLILQALYENDVMDEENIIYWYDSPEKFDWLVDKEAGKKSRASALPFVDWLKNADEEESGEE